MKPVIILRVDDVCAHTSPFELERVYGAWWRAGKPVCFSVIPCSAYRFESSGIYETPPRSILENRDLTDFLSSQIRAGLVEIALHGWQHHPGELAFGDCQYIRTKLERGIALLDRALPDARIRVLVPPHDFISPAGLEAAHSLGLTVCSTWAATHGGSRLAHYTGRLRRRLGKPYGHPNAFIIPTDINFDEPLESLKICGTAVLVQHYWRFLETGCEVLDYEVKRYADVLDHYDHI